jgi:hypothetical protein
MIIALMYSGSRLSYSAKMAGAAVTILMHQLKNCVCCMTLYHITNKFLLSNQTSEKCQDLSERFSLLLLLLLTELNGP